MSTDEASATSEDGQAITEMRRLMFGVGLLSQILADALVELGERDPASRDRVLERARETVEGPAFKGLERPEETGFGDYGHGLVRAVERQVRAKRRGREAH